LGVVRLVAAGSVWVGLGWVVLGWGGCSVDGRQWSRGGLNLPPPLTPLLLPPTTTRTPSRYCTDLDPSLQDFIICDQSDSESCLKRALGSARDKHLQQSAAHRQGVKDDAVMISKMKNFTTCIYE